MPCAHRCWWAAKAAKCSPLLCALRSQVLVGSEGGKVLRGGWAGTAPAPKVYVADDHKARAAAVEPSSPAAVLAGAVTCLAVSPAQPLVRDLRMLTHSHVHTHAHVHKCARTHDHMLTNEHRWERTHIRTRAAQAGRVGTHLLLHGWRMRTHASWQLANMHGCELARCSLAVFPGPAACL